MTTWADFERASTTNILAWAEAQPWAMAMADCQQDALWHAEGDVWTHTLMVIAELERLPDWQSLDKNSQLKLLFTALFHDSGKPATTHLDPTSGRTRSPKHAPAGAAICRNALRDLGCGLSVREEIVGLVRYHGRPPFLLEKPNPADEIIKHSWFVNHRLLYLFALADHERDARTSVLSRPERELYHTSGKWSPKKTSASINRIALRTTTRGFSFIGMRFPVCIMSRMSSIPAPSP